MEDPTPLAQGEAETESCFVAFHSSDDSILSSPEPVSEDAVANTPSPKADAPSEVAFLIRGESSAETSAITPEKEDAIANTPSPKAEAPSEVAFLISAENCAETGAVTPEKEDAVANTPSPKAEAPSEVAFLISAENCAETGAVTPEKAPLVACNLETPKRPQSAYFLYCNDERESVILACRAKNPDGKLSMADVAKELGQKWRQASDEVKKKYESVAAEQKAKYVSQTGGKTMHQRRKSAIAQSSKPMTDVVEPGLVEEPPEPPKRSKSAYMLFCDEERDAVIAAHRAERPEQKIVMSDVAKDLGQKWSNVSTDAKQKYESLAAQCKEQQQIEMREYIERFGRKPQKRKLFKIASPSEPKESPRIVKRRTLTTLDVDATVLAEAQQLSLEGQFMEFACSSVVLENGIVVKKAASARFLLKILKSVDGMIEEAKTKLQKKLQSARK